MQSTNGVLWTGDIGGPMDLGSGYRWNVPVITYGFDASVLDYFGTNGVAAVESAIQMLNELPPASSLALTSFPFDTINLNTTAQAQGLTDLKSQTISLLLEHLGLTQPERYIYAIKQWDSARIKATRELYGYPTNLIYLPESCWLDWAIPDYIVMRNFDPDNLAATPYVNAALYNALLYDRINNHQVIPYAADFLGPSFSAIAAFTTARGLSYGYCFTGLTYDDVGGLRYLLSTNTVSYETLLPDVQGIGTNALVNGAWRPGVDKITFLPHSAGLSPGTFLPMTNQYTDTYITNGLTCQQPVQRVICQPDFLFSVADLGNDLNPSRWFIPYFWRTGTTNWINHAQANGNTNGAGPGIIPPPVQITFNKLGFRYYTSGPQSQDENGLGGVLLWASFDASTNAPVLYPMPPTGANPLTVRMWLTLGTSPNDQTTRFEWNPSGTFGDRFTLQTSTNLQTWKDLFTATNDGTVCTYWNDYPASPSRFYRLIPAAQ